MGRVGHMDKNTVVIAMKRYRKKVRDFVANDHINLTVYKGEVHSDPGGERSREEHPDERPLRVYTALRPGRLR